MTEEDLTKRLGIYLCNDYKPCSKHLNQAETVLAIIKQHYKLEEIKHETKNPGN